jgi:glycine oxidase
MTRDVIIVGGGIIGCSIALRLAERGIKVTVIERGRIGCEASRAGAGMLTPQTEATEPGPFFDLCMRSLGLYPDFAAHVAELSGIDPERRAEGTLAVALTEADRAESGQWTSWQKAAGLALEHIDSDLLRKIEPSVARHAACAVFIPGDNQIENRRLMDGLAVAIRRLDVEVIEGRGADSLVVERSRVTGVVCEGEPLLAGSVVISAGCWSGELLEAVGINLKVIPARGQMLALKGDGMPINCVLHSSDCYLVPRSDGRVLVGATVEYVGFRKAVTAAGIRSLLASAVELVPALSAFEIVESWSGLRPDTVDHLPVLGPSGVEGLTLATGHFRNGILLAPLTAELIAGTILGGRAPVELQAFGVERVRGQMENLSHR